jgi:hypothetical protein
MLRREKWEVKRSVARAKLERTAEGGCPYIVYYYPTMFITKGGYASAQLRL